MENILEKFEEKILKISEEMSLELVDVEYVRDGGYNFLRVYVEKENGNTTIDDCAEFSHKIEDIADNLIKEKFFLEVSTPGLERKLKREKDFIKYAGNDIKLYAKSQIENKKTFEGKLEKFENETIFINDINLKKIVEIPFNKLKKSNIVYKIQKEILDEEE